MQLWSAVGSCRQCRGERVIPAANPVDERSIRDDGYDVAGARGSFVGLQIVTSLEVGVRRRWKLAIGLSAVGLGAWAADAWRLRADWRQARAEVAAGKYATALPRLMRLANRWPTDGEVLYHL